MQKRPLGCIAWLETEWSETVVRVNRGDLSPIDGAPGTGGVDGGRSQSPHISDEPRNK